MTDDRFMNSLRGEPRPEFSGSLWRRLAPVSPAEAPVRPRFRLFPPFAVAALAAGIVALVVFPSVRASAQAFLDLFRVKSFAAVPFDPARLEQLGSIEKDMELFVFDDKEPGRSGPPVEAASRADAEALVGFPVLEPSYLPEGLVPGKLMTTGGNQTRFSASSATLTAIVDALDLRDVDVPEDLDGKWIDVTLHPTAMQSWQQENGTFGMQLIQSRTPDVVLPPGLDLARLGEIGLRILGLDDREAKRVARSVDWNSTLLVPVPMNASEFREVSVRGQKGLLITTEDAGSRSDGDHHKGAVLLWAESGRVFALTGTLESEDVIAMAESLQ